MADKNLDRVIEKVKKLLALGDSDRNNSDEEAKAAMLKAQKLLSEYDLDIESLDMKETQEYSVKSCEHKWNYGFRIALGNALAKNFRCKVFTSNNMITFMGHPLDVEVCKNTFEFAYEYITHRGNQIYYQRQKLGQRTKGVFNSYAIGFIDGLKQVLEAQCTALALVTPDDVVKEFENMSKDWKTKTKVNKFTPDEVYEKGISEGKEFMSDKRLEGE